MNHCPSHDWDRYNNMMEAAADAQMLAYEEAFIKYHDEFSKWLMDNFIVWNGDRLIELEEDSDNFENFMAERHPEIGDLA